MWYLAHVVAVLLLNLAILEALGRRRPLLIGLAVGAAYWTRLPVILSLPFFLLVTAPAWAPDGVRAWRAIRWGYVMRMAAGVTLFMGLNFAYNWVRFGTPLDVAYLYRPGVAEEPWFQQGLFHPSYIARHLKVIFLGLPRRLDSWPYLVPSLSGLAIWMTTPAFAFALRAPWRHPLTLASWVAVAPVALVNAMHGTWGFAQFGYRFALDYYPFLFLLTAVGMGQRIRWTHCLLVGLGIAVNLWGVLATNIFSWATY
ncbi:MAG: hypothetical protein QN140_10110 [Armatimonadota bacterium]|nr:hypothetical protein [Armatimonadota bacterium]